MAKEVVVAARKYKQSLDELLGKDPVQESVVLVGGELLLILGVERNAVEGVRGYNVVRLKATKQTLPSGDVAFTLTDEALQRHGEQWHIQPSIHGVYLAIWSNFISNDKKTGFETVSA